MFLPRLFFNEMIARRFINNRIEYPDHAFILKRFRNVDIALKTLRKQYRDAMIPYLMINGAEVRSTTGWRRSKHVIPAYWDHHCIAMNDFVPDRIQRNRITVPPPKDVPFESLIKGVTQWPDHEDAADLTRAIRFVCQEPKRAGEMLQHAPMFPADLASILQKIHHAPMTKGRQDMMVLRRYGAERRRLAKLPHPIPGSVASNKEAAQSDTKGPRPPTGLEARSDLNPGAKLAVSQHAIQSATQEPAQNPTADAEPDHALWEPDFDPDDQSDHAFEGLMRRHGENVQPATGFTAEDYEDLFGEPAPKRLRRIDDGAS